MTKYREIIRLHCQGYSKRNIALSVPCSRNTATQVADRADELPLQWPLPQSETDAVLEKLFFTRSSPNTTARRLPGMQYVRTELQKNGVTQKLLWTEYLEECRQLGEEPLMYSQFCHYILEDKKKRKASMHIKRKPGEQVEVDWAGDPAHIIDPDTGEVTDVFMFVGAMSYSQYAYVEGFHNEATPNWITAALRNEQFFSLAELNAAIRERLTQFNAAKFQK